MELFAAIFPNGKHKFAIMALCYKGRCEYFDILRQLRSNRNVSAKIEEMLNNIATHGDGIYRGNEQLFRSVGDGLLELKPKDYRILMFQQGSTWIIVHAFQKPKGQDRVQSQWIREGRTRMNDYVEYASRNSLSSAPVIKK